MRTTKNCVIVRIKNRCIKLDKECFVIVGDKEKKKGRKIKATDIQVGTSLIAYNCDP